MRDNVTQTDRSPAISVRNLSKTFMRRGSRKDLVKPVDDVSIDIYPDELVVLLGPSGCGKTTLLRCVAGLETPDTGEIDIDGRTVFSSSRGILVPPEDRKLSMIFQSYALWPHMTIFDNVAYPLQTRGVASDEIRERVNDSLQVVGLKGLEKQYPSQISGGQQQRVALARAIVARTRVVLLDEPLSNVDAKVREQLRLELLTIKRQVGFSGLYVTHDQHEAMNLATRVAVLNNGRIAQIATPEEVYRRPSDDYVANFVGAANILKGAIASRSGRTAVVDTEIGSLSVVYEGAAKVGEAVQLVTRPESWRLSAEKREAANSRLVTLRESIFSGPHSEFIVNAGSRDLLIWSTADFSRFAQDNTAWASIEPDHIHVLEGTGRQ